MTHELDQVQRLAVQREAALGEARDVQQALDEDAEARHRYYAAFLNRGGDRNIAILDEITGLRRELADLYDLDRYEVNQTPLDRGSLERLLESASKAIQALM